MLIFACVKYSTAQLQSEKLRVLNEVLQRGLELLCPETGSPLAQNTVISQDLIYWVDENGISDVPDHLINIMTLKLLTPIQQNRFTFIFTHPYKDLSCGYYWNNTYTRIKRWSLSYVDKAEVEFKQKVDPSFFNLKKFNETFYAIDYKISNSTLISQSQSRKIFRLDCEPNFDRPLPILTILWLRYLSVKNNKTVEETLRMGANSQQVYKDDKQYFENEIRKVEFMDLLKNLYNSEEKSIFIELQCETYKEGSEKPIPFVQSNRFNLFRASADTGEAGGLLLNNLNFIFF